MPGTAVLFFPPPAQCVLACLTSFKDLLGCFDGGEIYNHKQIKAKTLDYNDQPWLIRICH